MPYFSVLPYTETTSNFIANSCASFQNAFVSIQEINLEIMEAKLNFGLALDLSDFPEYSKTNEYLRQNLEIQLIMEYLKSCYREITILKYCCR